MQGAVQGAPDYVCHWGVRVLSRVLSRVLRIMFAIGVVCRGAVRVGCCAGVLFRVLRIMFAIGVSGCCPGCSGSRLLLGCQGAVEGAVEGAVQGACLRLGGVRVLSRVLCKGQGKQSGTRIQCFNFYLGSMLV